VIDSSLKKLISAASKRLKPCIYSIHALLGFETKLKTLAVKASVLFVGSNYIPKERLLTGL